MSADRIKFIINTSAEYFNVAPAFDDDEVAIKEFFENDDLTVLTATRTNNHVIFLHEIPQEAEFSLIFYKIPKSNYQVHQTSTTVANNENHHRDQQIGLLTLEGGMVKSIYNSVTRVFSAKSSKRSEYSPELINIIETLQTNLSNTLGLSDTGIHSIQNEINFWRNKLSHASTKADKEAAKNFSYSLEKINERLTKEELDSLSSIEEFLDFSNNALDEIWRLPYQYPQNRMKNVLDLLSSIIITGCIDITSKEDIWNANPIYIYGTMTQAKEIANSWIQQCDTLTRLFWTNYSQHTWIGDAYIPMLAVHFKERIEEILQMKNIHKQISTLFIHEQQQHQQQHQDQILLKAEYLFAPFREINIYDIGPLGQKRWYKAKKEFEYTLTQIDDKIAILLKGLIHNHLNNTRQVVHIFNKYQNVLSRDTVRKALVAERENLLSTLPKLFLDLRDTLMQSQLDVGDRSQIVTESKWLKIVEHQLIEIQKICDTVLNDLKGFDIVFAQLKEFIEETQALLKVNFQTWCERSLDAVRSGDLVLHDNAPVVKFDEGEGLMFVTFNPMFINFCNDVREFEALGYRVPTELHTCARHASKFISHARHLQQIASFHNTVGDRMVPCQRPIMLKNAVELSRLVKSESVSWNDEASVTRYIAMLQAAVNKLSHDNNLLTGYHMNAIKIIGKLMTTDLIRQSGSWKDEMKSLRDIISTLERQGYSNLNAFKLHLDHQLYKVLEYQYITGLIDINHKLPEISIDIVFRQQQLQFRPTIEEIRSKYFSQLRKFLEKPMSFRGVSDQGGKLFRTMVERNRERFTTLYQAGDNILKKLDTVKETWLPWVALGCVDIEELCNKYLKTWEQWDMNFKTCKHFSQQIAKIQKTEERLDCFVINLSPLRSDIEFISRRYWEALVYSLRSSILEDISVLQEYLTNALQVLQHIPLDEKGIIDTSAKYEKIVADYPKMSSTIQSVQNKDTCLAGWCKERVSALSTLIMQWDQLQPLIDNHQTLLQGQLDVIKQNIEVQVDKMAEEASKFALRWEATLKDLEASDETDITLFRERQNQWKMIQDKKDHLLIECTKFNVQFPDKVNEIFAKVENEFKKQSEQWEVYENFMVEYDEVGTEEWAVYRRRPYLLTDFLAKWESKLASTAVTISSVRIQNLISRIRGNLPNITLLQSDALVDRHWAKIIQILGMTSKSYHDVKLKELLTVIDGLEQNATEIQNIVRQATSEQIVRQAITELEQWGVTAILKTTIHTDSKGTPLTLVKEFQDVLNKIGDNQCLLQSAKNSVAFDSFSDQAEIWESKLTNLDYILTNINQIQRKWIYLEPIFSVGTLKNDENIFLRIDKDFRYIMREIEQDTKILSLLKIHNIMSIINALINQLTRCQNTLTSYITAKRNAFARFYFLGDDDLLEILGQSTKEIIIQKHIKKLFPGVFKVGIVVRDNTSFITTIYSAEGDEIKLKNDVCMKSSVEVKRTINLFIVATSRSSSNYDEWLNQFVSEIKSTMKDLIVKCCKHEQITLDQIKKYPMQVICLANQISFTKQTEKAIGSMTLQNHLKFIKNSISQYSGIMQQQQQQQDTGSYQNAPEEQKVHQNLIQIKIRALLFDLVWQTTTIEYLLKHNVTNLQDWHWLQQLKFYLNEKDQIVRVRMVFAEFEYSYEFLGNYSKLVYTSLAHNCYLTLTQAMHLGCGGNPFGPAGTGKTECVKALGAMLGRLVFVFNCDENIDTTAMALILSGLARCGAWGCFDEFNRLQDSTLSAISMLIQPLQTALKEQKREVCLMEENIPLNPHCCIFVTLNPAGAEYGGRQQLPANLQALFRPIVMQQPEPKEIARVMLFVEGFQFADRIGFRIVELFDLAQKMLSSQRHYNWGLRELKTVLLGCGRILKELKTLDNVTTSEEKEMEIAVQALRSNTMSKLTVSDGKRFDMLIADVFPNTSLTVTLHDTLRTCIRQAFSATGLIANERQIEKCLELYEQLQKRMGVVIIGPPNSGKTSIISLLKEALALMQQTIRTYTISPKSMTRDQLLGKLDPDTRQWHDGVLTTVAIAANSEPLNVTSWTICDGDCDPEWLEALNSVLDDNRLLTLPSGWRIQFGNNVNFIFETHDLSNASPATISRMGIINLSSEDLNHTLIIESWLSKQTNSDDLKYFIENYFYKALSWIEDTKNWPDFTTQIGFIKCGLQTVPATVHNKDEFCINMLRGFTSTMDIDARNEFANKVFQWADIYVHNPGVAEYCFYNNFRSAVEVYDTDELSTTAYNGSGSGNNGDNSIGSGGTNNVLIKTAIVKVNSETLRAFLRSEEKPLFLLVGLSGSGKSLLLQNVTAEFSGYQLVTIHCSAQITANYITYILKQNCISVSGVRGKEYKPKFVRLILYLKNIELCPIDSYGSSEVIELLLQLINRNGFYSETLEWISISGLQICGSMNGITKQNLSSRFLAKAKYLIMGYPSAMDMQKIVQCMLSPVLNKFDNMNGNENMNQLAESMINVYSEITNRFNANQSVHYRFSPKMLENWIKGIQHYPSDKIREAIIYECDRIFGDRFINATHHEEYTKFVQKSFKGTPFTKTDAYFIPSSAKSTQLQYNTTEQWQEILLRTLSIANTENLFIDTPITSELLDLAANICRVLSRPRTNLTLCGMTGSGRNEAIALATTFLHIKTFGPTPVNSYGLNDFYNDLKIAMQSAALENEVVVFVIDQMWLSYSKELMKPIEAVLEGSEIPDLFGDDLETIAGPLKNTAQMEGYQESLVMYFQRRVQRNLHLILILETTSSTLQELFEEYPAIYRSTEIIWIKELSSVTLELLPKLNLEILEPSSKNEPLAVPQYFNYLKNFDLKWAKSPKRFSQLIKTYYHIYKQIKGQKESYYNKLKKGVDKLSEAHSVVDRLKTEATEQQTAVAEKRKLANQALEMISTTMRSANNQKTDMLELKKQTEESSKKLMIRQKAIEEELSLVEPILKEASAAVGQIKSEALSEIRSLRAPPDTVRDILEGVLRLMGIRDTSWNSMKTFLAKRGVKEDIRSLDPARISPENCVSVEKLLKAKSDSFDERNAKRASAAAAPLAAWVKANVQYSKVIQSIKPLEREQNELQANLARAEAEMSSLSSGLDDVNAKVKKLSDQLNMYTQEAAVLEIKLKDAQSTLSSATVLIEKLSSEYTNWSKELEVITNEIQQLSLIAFIVSLCITQLSDMLIDERLLLLEKLSKILNVKTFSIEDMILKSQDKVIYESIGLTPDQQSMENAAILTQMLTLPFGAAPLPLLLDPTGQSLKWLKGYLALKETAFEETYQNADRFTYNLELAVRFGKVVIVHEGQNLSPPLLSLITMKTYNRFNKKMIQIGNKLVDLHENFRLVLHTNSKSVKLNGDMSAFLTPIHFTITSLGFTDQLMLKWIILKKPELEQKRVELLRNEGELLQKKTKLQDTLLEELSNAQGDILKNEQLFNTLNNIKESTISIEESLKESYEVRSKLMEDYNEFKPICSSSARFYVGISKIYNFTTMNFVQLFLKAADTDNTAETEVIYKKLVRQTYIILSRSVARKDQIALGLNICKHAYPDVVPEKEWELFVFNFMMSENATDDLLPAWIPAELTPKLQSIKSQTPNFYTALQLQDENIWRKYIDTSRGGSPEIPVNVTDFQKILIAQVFRPDLLVCTITASVSKILGIKNLSGMQLSIKHLSEESSADQPILIVASSGADPAADIKECAKNNRKELVEVSIGKGQEKHTLSQIKSAAESGNWICIKNVHLAPKWLISLNEEFRIAQLNPSFRMWMVCDSDKGFSESFVNSCTKIVFEPPVGIKSKIKYLFEQYSNVMTVKRNFSYIKPHVALFILHAIIQERRSYVPQGWCKWYEFGEADLKAAMDLLAMILKANSTAIDWPLLQGLCKKIAYGGRVDYMQDFDKLEELLQEFFDSSIMNNRWSPLKLPIILLNSGDVQEYFNAIDELPDGENPEIIGLSPSTNISKDLIFCRNLLKDLRSKYFNVEEGQNYDKRIKPILNLWKKLVSVTTVMKTYEMLKTDVPTDDPWIIFKQSELILGGKLFNLIHKTLTRLHAVMKDPNAMSKPEIVLMKCLCENQVPMEWKKLWNGPKLATDFIKSVVTKGVEAEKRYRGKDRLEGEMNFGEMYNVRTFLATFKLIKSREMKVSTSNLTLRSNFDLNKKHDGSVLISPIKIDGASFKNNRLTLTSDKSSSVSKTDKFEIFYISKENGNLGSSLATNTMEIPLYDNILREELICMIQVDVVPSPSDVIYSGAAFIVPE